MARKPVLVGLVVLLGVSLAGATTLVKMDFGQLSKDAEQIVVGTVVGVEGEWDPSLRFIRSNVTLAVEHSLRGAAPEQLVVRTPGGWVGGTGQKAHGAATFEVGERVLVFLTSWEDGTAKVLGYAQGKSGVVRDARGVDRLVGGSGNGLSLEGAVREIEEGPKANIALRPANGGE